MSGMLAAHLRRSGLFFGGWLGCNLLIAFMAAQHGAVALLLFLWGLPISLGAVLLGGVLYVADGVRLAFDVERPSERAGAALAVPAMIAGVVPPAAVSLEVARQASLAGVF